MRFSSQNVMIGMSVVFSSARLASWARNWSRRWISVMLFAQSLRLSAQSTAVSPPPMIRIFLPRNGRLSFTK